VLHFVHRPWQWLDAFEHGRGR
jgi:TnpA family transposase